MAPAHKAVPEVETASSQDITYSDTNLEAAWAALYPEAADLYNGDDAMTIPQIADIFDIPRSTARDRAELAVKEGRMLEVKIDTGENGPYRFKRAFVVVKEG